MQSSPWVALVSLCDRSFISMLGTFAFPLCPFRRRPRGCPRNINQQKPPSPPHAHRHATCASQTSNAARWWTACTTRREPSARHKAAQCTISRHKAKPQTHRQWFDCIQTTDRASAPRGREVSKQKGCYASAKLGRRRTSRLGTVRPRRSVDRQVHELVLLDDQGQSRKEAGRIMQTKC